MITIAMKELVTKKLFRRVETGELLSFTNLMQIRNENPEIVILMDEETKKQYLECLEAWC